MAGWLDRLRGRAPETPAERLAAAGLAATSVAAGGYAITGKTFGHRDALRAAGGTWQADDRTWHLAGDAQLEALSSLLAGEAVPAPQVAAGLAEVQHSYGSKHFHGHRERVRQKFLEHGGDAMADYELLELLLFFSVYRRDTKPLAKALLTRFGSLHGVLAAKPDQLAEIGEFGGDERDREFTAILASAVKAIGERTAKRALQEGPVIGSEHALAEYLDRVLADAEVEEFRVLFLDSANQLIRDERLGKGTIDHTPLYPREVVKRALDLGAVALILVHNHPSGDPTPSSQDIAATRDVAAALAAVNVDVYDHVIVGRGRQVSLREQGLI